MTQGPQDVWGWGYLCSRLGSHFGEGQLSAKGADLALTAAPLAAGIGQAHHHIPALAVSFAKGFQDFLGNERASWPVEPFLLDIFGCKA